MKRHLLSFLLIAPAICLADNLFKNSEMDTSSTWKGDRKFETVENNRVMALEAKKNRTVSFSQEVDARDITDAVLKFRYRTKDYKGRGLQIRGIRQDSSFTYRNIDLKADDEWHDISWGFSEFRDSNKITFLIELLEGEGTLLVDDVTLTP